MDAFVLCAVVAEIRRTLPSGVVRDVVAAGPEGLWLEFATPAGAGSLLATVESAAPRLVSGVPRPPRVRPLPPLAGAARRVLAGSRLTDVRHTGLDRVVRLDFAPAPGPGGPQAPGGYHLVLELFGRTPNLLVTDDAGRILEAARHLPGAARPQAPGLAYVPPGEGRPDPRLSGDAEAVAAVLAPLLAAGLDPRRALRQGFRGVGALWADEVARGAGDGSPLELARALCALLQRVAAGPWEPRLVLDEAGEIAAVAPVPLVSVPAERQRPSGSLGEAVGAMAREAGSRQGTATRQRELLRLVRRLAERLASRREKLAAEAAEFARAEGYQRMGEILVAQQAAVPRGASEVVLADYAGEPDATVRIPLDPALGPGANAERLFQAARRGRRGMLRVAGRLAETERDLAWLAALEPQLLEAGGTEGLDGAVQEIERMPHLLGPRERAVLRQAEPGIPGPGAPGPAGRPAPASPTRKRRGGDGPEPRRFVSSEGLPILVGRDNAGNDHLTQHLARSEDLWLHAEGFPGSHVVVRMQGRTGGVPRQTLLEAAKLAAYYSQARNHGKVAVSYTLKKYVRKPRKSPPGLVAVSHEKTVIVTPDKGLVARLAAGGEGATDNREPTTDNRPMTP